MSAGKYECRFFEFSYLPRQCRHFKIADTEKQCRQIEANMSAALPTFPNIPGVRFKEVWGWKGYAVSDDGRLWSCKRPRCADDYLNQWTPIRVPWSGPKGNQYRRAFLYDHGDKRQVMLQVLIAEAFIGPVPAGYEVAHYPDPDTGNNAASNLKIVTRSANQLHHRQQVQTHPDVVLGRNALRRMTVSS